MSTTSDPISDAANLEITATLVPESQRINFLPEMFGSPLFVRAEPAVYGWMARICPTYGGGFWDFYKLSNGGFYMAPSAPAGERLPITISGNGYGGTMSADAAGIVATLFALSHLLFEPLNHEDQNRLTDAFHSLRAFALAHAEERKILAAVD